MTTRNREGKAERIRRAQQWRLYDEGLAPRPGGPELDLRPDLLSCPTDLDLAYIETEMLWPDDPEWRQRARDAATVEWVHSNSLFSDAQDLSLLASVSRNAFPIDYVQDEVKKERFLRGVIVGSVLHNLLFQIATNPEKANKQQIIDACIAPYKKTSNKGIVRITRQHFNNEIWPMFESVAHLWAAAFKAAKHDGSSVFPCHKENVRDFLADAEFYRVMGEQSRTWKSPTTVLRSEKTIKLPSSLGILPSELEFQSR